MRVLDKDITGGLQIVDNSVYGPTPPERVAVPQFSLNGVFGHYFTCGASALPVPVAAGVWHSPKSLATAFTKNL